MRTEVLFYNNTYKQLISNLDWRGVLLKAHINWLGQRLTHCVLRIETDGIDRIYTATWFGLRSYPTSDFIYPPAEVIDVSNFNQVNIIDRTRSLFTSYPNERITLKNILLMMKGKPEQVKGVLCTSFVCLCLGITVRPDNLYPDKLFKLLKRIT